MTTGTPTTHAMISNRVTVPKSKRNNIFKLTIGLRIT